MDYKDVHDIDEYESEKMKNGYSFEEIGRYYNRYSNKNLFSFLGNAKNNFYTILLIILLGVVSSFFDNRLSIAINKSSKIVFCFELFANAFFFLSLFVDDYILNVPTRIAGTKFHDQLKDYGHGKYIGLLTPLLAVCIFIVIFILVFFNTIWINF